MKYTLLLSPILLLLLSSCITAPVKIPESGTSEEVERLKIVQYAESLLGQKNIVQINGWFRNDCSGYVLGVYRSLGYKVRLLPKSYTRKISLVMYDSLNRRGLTYQIGIPRRADVVFFKGTVAGMGDKVSHVGIVADVLENGTIRILNYTSKGVTELMMNLDYPSIHKDENGTIKNDFLRKKNTYTENEKLLSGELFYSFGDLYRYSSL